MATADRDELQGMLRAAIVSVEEQLPSADIANAWELVEAGEEGVALETLCTQLYEYEVAVSFDTVELLRRAGNQMSMDSRLWEDLTIRRSNPDTLDSK